MIYIPSHILTRIDNKTNVFKRYKMDDKLFRVCVESGIKFLLLDDEKKMEEEAKKIKWFKEEKCRDILHTLLFPKKFPSIRPDFLKNPMTGMNLELDGYNSELRLAFEFQGIQHYKFTKKFHKTKQDLIYQQEKDKWKVSKCKEKGIVLLVISYREKDIYKYIYEQLQISYCKC